jgi:hypothetical protein
MKHRTSKSSYAQAIRIDVTPVTVRWPDIGDFDLSSLSSLPGRINDRQITIINRGGRERIFGRGQLMVRGMTSDVRDGVRKLTCVFGAREQPWDLMLKPSGEWHEFSIHGRPACDHADFVSLLPPTPGVKGFRGVIGRRERQVIMIPTVIFPTA